MQQQMSLLERGSVRCDTEECGVTLKMEKGTKAGKQLQRHGKWKRQKKRISPWNFGAPQSEPREPNSEFLSPRPIRQYVCVVLSNHIYGNMSQQPQKINTEHAIKEAYARTVLTRRQRKGAQFSDGLVTAPNLLSDSVRMIVNTIVK